MCKNKSIFLLPSKHKLQILKNFHYLLTDPSTKERYFSLHIVVVIARKSYFYFVPLNTYKEWTFFQRTSRDFLLLYAAKHLPAHWSTF